MKHAQLRWTGANTKIQNTRIYMTWETGKQKRGCYKERFMGNQNLNGPISTNFNNIFTAAMMLSVTSATFVFSLDHINTTIKLTKYTDIKYKRKTHLFPIQNMYIEFNWDWTTGQKWEITLFDTVNLYMILCQSSFKFASVFLVFP